MFSFIRLQVVLGNIALRQKDVTCLGKVKGKIFKISEAWGQKEVGMYFFGRTVSNMKGFCTLEGQGCIF